MKARYVAGLALAAALTVAVSTAAARTDSPTRASASKITVWLQVDAQSRAMVGATLELAVDPRRFHFFDPETGARLTTSGAPVLAGA